MVNDQKIIFPAHPRVRKQLETVLKHQITIGFRTNFLLKFNWVVQNCLCYSDSGALQEATFMSVPCITLRENTERPETVSEGNILVGEDLAKLSARDQKMKMGIWKTSSIPKLWDGRTAERI